VGWGGNEYKGSQKTHGTNAKKSEIGLGRCGLKTLLARYEGFFRSFLWVQEIEKIEIPGG